MHRPPTGTRAGAMAVLSAIAFALAVAPTSAGAQAKPDASKPDAAKPDYAKAKVHYAAAETAAGEGRWSDAARDYDVAYQITKDPVLFFKIGNANDKGGDCATALTFYRRYLAEAKPAEEFAKLTSDKIAACQEKAGAEAGAGAEPGTGAEPGAGTGAGTGTEPGTGAEPTPPPDPSTTANPFAEDDDEPIVAADPLIDPATVGQPSWQRTAAWISVGVGVAFGVTGSVLGLAASSREDDIRADIDFRDGTTELPARFQGTAAERYDDLVAQGDKLELAAFISFGAAGAAVAAAVVFFVIDPGSERASGAMTIAPTIGEGGLGLAAGWSFE